MVNKAYHSCVAR